MQARRPPSRTRSRLFGPRVKKRAETRPEIVGIVIGSTIKGIVTGLLIGLFERKVRSLPLGVLFGLLVGAFLAFLIARMNGYYWQIMLPGSLLGVIVGYATNRYGGPAAVPRKSRTSSREPSSRSSRSRRRRRRRRRQPTARRPSSASSPWPASGRARWARRAASVRYEVGSGGTIVRELLFPGTEHEMLSVYHLGGGQLVATHYCAVGNQRASSSRAPAPAS